MKPSRVFRALLLADTHCGSRYALVPPQYRPAKAGPAGVFMEYVWSIYQDMLRRLPPLDLVIHDGDACEGEHPTLRSAPDAIDTSPLRQTDMAIETLGPLRDKTKHFWLVRGSGFHDGKWCEALERLGAELKAEMWSDRRYSGEVLEGTFGGYAWNVAHAQTTGAIYPGTLQNRTAWFANMADGLAKTVPADIIVRAHTHASSKGYYMGKWVLSCRCWKLVNPYAVARMEYYRAQALLDLGAHLVTITDDGICWKDFSYEPYKPKALRALA